MIRPNFDVSAQMTNESSFTFPFHMHQKILKSEFKKKINGQKNLDEIYLICVYIYVYIWNQFVEQSRRGKETKIANCRKKNIGERWKCFSMTDSNYDVLKSRHTANFFFFLSIHIFYAFEFEPFRSLSLCHGASAYMYKKNCCLFDRNWIFRMHHNNRMIHIFFLKPSDQTVG